MKYSMVRPCDTCPFRHDVPGFLRNERAEEIAGALFDLDECFPCHKTVEFDERDDDNDAEGQSFTAGQHCAGAMILLERYGRGNQLMRIAERLRLYDRRKLDMTAPVFQTREAFVEHHNS